MARFVRFGIVAVVGAAFVGYGAWRNPEQGPLNAAARTFASGQFEALSGGVTHYDMTGPDTGRVVRSATA